MVELGITQQYFDSMNAVLENLGEKITAAYLPLNSTVLVSQIKEISKTFEDLAESVSKNFSDLPTSTFADTLRHIDEMYQRDILPAISRIEFPENFEPSPISEECMEKLSDVADTLPKGFEEKPKLVEVLKNKKWSLKSILETIAALITILAFIQQQIYPQKEEVTNININNVNIVEINSQNEDVVSEDLQKLSEKILDVISELMENIDNIDGDIVSGGIVEPDRLDCVENDMDE